MRLHLPIVGVQLDIANGDILELRWTAGPACPVEGEILSIIMLGEATLQ